MSPVSVCECACVLGCEERIKTGYVNNGTREPLNIEVGCARQILSVMSLIQ